MNKEFAKMCYFARLEAGLSVKNASELLNICERQLNYYELKYSYFLGILKSMTSICYILMSFFI